MLPIKMLIYGNVLEGVGGGQYFNFQKDSKNHKTFGKYFAPIMKMCV